MHRIRVRAFAVLLVLLGGLGLVQPSYAATIPVTTPADEFGAAGAGCALREAIQAANTDAAFGGCPAGNGDDTITLPAGAYILSIAGANDDLNHSGDLDIWSNISIHGTGAASTIIDGAATDRVLDVLFGAAISISNITVRNGNVNGTGGGINVPSGGARVTITDAAIDRKSVV